MIVAGASEQKNTSKDDKIYCLYNRYPSFSKGGMHLSVRIYILPLSDSKTNSLKLTSLIQYMGRNGMAKNIAKPTRLIFACFFVQIDLY